MMKYASLILVAMAASTFAAPASGTGNCGSLGVNGATVESGFVYYLCQDGKLFPKGCVTRDQQHVEIGQTTDYRGGRYACSLSGSQLPSLELKGCVKGGQLHDIDSEFNDNTLAYQCKRNGENAEVVVVGCVDNGKTVKFNEETKKDDHVYVCQEAGDVSRLVKAGCVHHGQQFKLGDSFEDGETWFNCTYGGPKAAGCVADGRRLNDGDRFFKNDVILECFIDNGKNNYRVAGCVQHDDSQTIERRLGCFWVEGPEPLQYEWTCKHDKAGNTAEKVKVRCNYRVSKGVYNIEPGCYRMIDSKAFGCVKSGDDLKFQSFEGEDAAKSATSAGLHAC